MSEWGEAPILHNSRRKAMDSLRESYMLPDVLAQLSDSRPSYAMPKRYDPFAKGREALMPGQPAYLMGKTDFDKYRLGEVGTQPQDSYMSKANAPPDSHYRRRERDMMQDYTP